MRLTTICENTASMYGITGEWGLSILIESGDERILFDTGLSDVITTNARMCGVNLSTVDRLVLSHGHSDHTGGLRAFLKAANKKIPVYGHPDMWIEKYSKRPESGRDNYNFIGIPFTRDELEGLGAIFKMSKTPVWLNEHVVTTGEVPMVTSFEAVDSNLYVKANGEMVLDELWDDQAVIVKTKKGLVVVLGCAHRGMVNTMLHAKEITGIDKIHAVIGGTHLFRAGEEQLRKTIAAIKDLKVEKIGVSHCTGPMASAVLAREFGDSFFSNNAGTITDW